MLAGLLPVPGPFDALVLLVAGVVLAVFYRGPLRDAWADSTKRVDKFVSAGIGSGPVESPSTEGGTQI